MILRFTAVIGIALLAAGPATGRVFRTVQTPVPGATIALAQIDRPRTDAEHRWNAAAAQALDAITARRTPLAERDSTEWASRGDVDEYRLFVEAQAPGFIESILSWRGGSRWGFHRPLHWSLTLGRPITAADLFDDPPRAFDAIAALALAEAERSALTDKSLQGRIPEADQIRLQAQDLAQWLFTQGALELTLDAVPPDLLVVQIPWSRITPLLKNGAAFNPARLRVLN